MVPCDAPPPRQDFTSLENNPESHVAWKGAAPQGTGTTVRPVPPLKVKKSKTVLLSRGKELYIYIYVYIFSPLNIYV